MKSTTIFQIGLLSICGCLLFPSAWNSCQNIGLFALLIALAIYANVYSLRNRKMESKNHKSNVPLAVMFLESQLGLYVSLIFNHINPAFFDRLVFLLLIAAWISLSSLTLVFYRFTNALHDESTQQITSI